MTTFARNHTSATNERIKCGNKRCIKMNHLFDSYKVVGVVFWWQDHMTERSHCPDGCCGLNKCVLKKIVQSLIESTKIAFPVHNSQLLSNQALAQCISCCFNWNQCLILATDFLISSVNIDKKRTFFSLALLELLDYTLYLGCVSLAHALFFLRVYIFRGVPMKDLC